MIQMSTWPCNLINMPVFCSSKQTIMHEHDYVMSHVHACVLPKWQGSLHKRVARGVSLNFFF